MNQEFKIKKASKTLQFKSAQIAGLSNYTGQPGSLLWHQLKSFQYAAARRHNTTQSHEGGTPCEQRIKYCTENVFLKKKFEEFFYRVKSIVTSRKLVVVWEEQETESNKWMRRWTGDGLVSGYHDNKRQKLIWGRGIGQQCIVVYDTLICSHNIVSYGLHDLVCVFAVYTQSPRFKVG